MKRLQLSLLDRKQTHGVRLNLFSQLDLHPWFFFLCAFFT
jgi:hypothetical protein